jgi:hypothetical protein
MTKKDFAKHHLLKALQGAVAAAAGIYVTVKASDNLRPGSGYWIAVTEARTIYP